jgi:hypothetical protein
MPRIRVHALRCLGILFAQGIFILSTATTLADLFSTDNAFGGTGDTYSMINGNRDNDSALSDIPNGSCKNKDWSFGRTKFSCPKGLAINGVIHAHGEGNTFLNVHCGTALATPMLTCEGQDKSWKWLELVDTGFNNPFDCGNGWYMSGASFVDTVNTQGLKSLLCVREENPRKQELCAWKETPWDFHREVRCGFNMFVRGVKTSPIKDRQCRNGKRKDDTDNARCDRITEIYCCERA